MTCLTGVSFTSLPNCLNDLELLQSIDLRNNALVGPLPELSPSQLNMESIQLSGNQLTGGIPREYGSLPSLVNLIINDNDLSGCYHVQLKNLCQSPIFLTGQNSFVSDGNSFNTPWEDFCNSSTGECCDTELVLDWIPLLDGTYRSSGNIILQSDILNNANIELSHGIGNQVLGQNSINIGQGASIIISDEG